MLIYFDYKPNFLCAHNIEIMLTSFEYENIIFMCIEALLTSFDYEHSIFHVHTTFRLYAHLLIVNTPFLCAYNNDVMLLSFDHGHYIFMHTQH